MFLLAYETACDIVFIHQGILGLVSKISGLCQNFYPWKLSLQVYLNLLLLMLLKCMFSFAYETTCDIVFIHLGLLGLVSNDS